MNCSPLQLNDLPDELLLNILKRLSNVEVLSSLLDVNERLNQVVRDPVFTSRLVLLIHRSDNRILPLPHSTLDRFCLQILPKINHKSKWLHLEYSTVERIFLSANYPNLYGLIIHSIEKKTALRLFTDQNNFTDLYKHQITALAFGSIIKKNDSTDDMDIELFAAVLCRFSKLERLNFDPFYTRFQDQSSISSSSVFSSNLRELHIRVRSFSDCLSLLDGRFTQLRTFFVEVALMCNFSQIENEGKLPNLRCFSFFCPWETGDYDTLIVPLLHRMSNLEYLFLHIAACQKRGFIDGNNLKENVITYLPRLRRFFFNIRSIAREWNQIDTSSNEDIQKTFNDFKDQQIVSCVNFFPEEGIAHCHVYCCPYTIRCYDKIANNFPGGLFPMVREVSLYDELPFEHEFFLQITQSFPMMQQLTVTNHKPQRMCRRSLHGHDELSINEYPHLIDLLLYEAHEDYIEEFLDDARTCLPNGMSSCHL